MEAALTLAVMLGMFIIALLFVALLTTVIRPPWYYHDWHDWHFWRRREVQLQDEIDSLRREQRQEAPPPKQIVEHRHVHVHVDADGKAISPKLLAPPTAVQQAADEVGGIPVQVVGGWNVTDHKGNVLIEMRKPPANRQLEMR